MTWPLFLAMEALLVAALCMRIAWAGSSPPPGRRKTLVVNWLWFMSWYSGWAILLFWFSVLLATVVATAIWGLVVIWRQPRLRV